MLISSNDIENVMVGIQIVIDEKDFERSGWMTVWLVRQRLTPRRLRTS